jgi:hypothetical protein
MRGDTMSDEPPPKTVSSSKWTATLPG